VWVLNFNAIADRVESSHLMTNKTNCRRAEVILQALLEAVDNNPPEITRLCDVLKVSVTDTEKACGNNHMSDY
jgi:hypothetical protein